MAENDDWSSNANEALQIRLPNSKPFHPAFSYAIFGNEELIFGYKGLKIKLDFAGNTLNPSLDVTWQQKYEQVGDTKADDVEAILGEFLPAPNVPSAAPTADTEQQTIWEPPGELLQQYEVDGRAFGIWSTTLVDPAARALLQNMEILVLFFIEGASLLDLSDSDSVLERWRIFLLYEINALPSTPNASTYSLVGYATTFRLYFIDPSSPDFAFPSTTSSGSYSDFALESNSKLTSHLPCRQRISQFLILPNYQHKGHGSHLYTSIIRFCLSTSTVKEITVEDPNEIFDDLRDVNDLLRMRDTNPSFASLKLNTNVRLPSKRTEPIPSSDLLSSTILDTIRAETKIAPRQFARLVEMQLLSSIPYRHRNTARITRKDRASDENDRAYYFWRLLAKQRLYKFNLDQLAQLDLEERIDKLEETLGGVERDYVRLLEIVEQRSIKSKRKAAITPKSATTAGVTEVVPKNGTGRGRKRRIVDEEDESSDERELTPLPVKPTASNGKMKKRTKTEVVDLASSEL